MGPFAVALVPILLKVVLSFVVTAIGAAVSKAFTKKPKKSPLAFQDRTVTIRQSIEPWHGVVGSARVGGDLLFFERDGTDIWIGAEWAHHESKAIDSIYTDDTQNFVFSDGSVRGANNGKLEIYNHLGGSGETADAAVMAAFPLKWTADHIGYGITKSFLRFVNVASNWNNTLPNVSADLRGMLFTDPRTGVRDFTDNLPVVARGLLMDADFGEGETAENIDDVNFIAEANSSDEWMALPNWSEYWVIDDLTTFTVLNLASDTIQIVTTGIWFTGDKVYVSNIGGGLPAGLSAGVAYYYRVTASNQGQLFDTEAHALAAPSATGRIDITTNGTPTHRMQKASPLFRMLGRETTFTANTGTDALTMAALLNMTFQDRFVVDGAALAAPLVAGTVYEVLNGTGIAAFTLVTHSGHAAVNITTAGTPPQNLRLLGNNAAFGVGQVDIAADTIDVTAGNGAGPTPDALSPRFAARPLRVFGSNLPAPLTSGQGVFMIPYDASKIRLAASAADAHAGVYIDLTTTGSGGDLSIEALDVAQEECRGLVTGMEVALATATGSGALPTGLPALGYAIRRGGGYFQIAATLEDALGGIAAEVTDPGTDTNLTYKITLKRERRYTANMVIDTDQDTLDIEKALGAGCAGTLLEPLGSAKWRIKTGIYRLPLGALRLKDIRQGGTIEIQPLLEGSQAATTMKGVYAAPVNFDHPSDAPVIGDPAFVAEDGGEERIASEQLPCTNSKWMAQRILQIDLRRRRLQNTQRFPVTLVAGFTWEYGDGVAVDLSPLPVAMDMEISGWNFQTGAGGEGPPKPSIDLTLRENDPWAYISPFG